MRVFWAFVFVSVVGCTSTSAETDPSLARVRLGMSPRDVRERFAPGEEGSFAIKVANGTDTGEDTILEWAPSATPRARIESARFEFHLGMLVAVRERVKGGASSSPRTIHATSKTVSVRTPTRNGDEGIEEITWLSRDCPAHHAEAEALAAAAR